MDIALLLKAAVMGIVEGLTEFLPISSTGHLILAGSLIGFTGEAAKVFEIAIQTGAMLAVVWLYRARFRRTFAGLGRDPVATRFATNLAIAFVPAAVAGLAIGKIVKAHLFRPVPVAAAFIVGGLVILAVEARQRRMAAEGRAPRIVEVDDMSAIDALKVGCVQCLALIPGMSRSGSLIIGGLLLGLSRKAATEFSFFLGVPTLMAAGAYSIWKERHALHASDLPMFLVGTVFAFIFAMLCVKWLIRFVSSHDFTGFAWYRIGFGLVVLLTAYTGWVNWTE